MEGDNASVCMVVTTGMLADLLSYLHMLYCSGVGFDSVDVFLGIVRFTASLQWCVDDSLVTLAIIDADVPTKQVRLMGKSYSMATCKTRRQPLRSMQAAQGHYRLLEEI